MAGGEARRIDAAQGKRVARSWKVLRLSELHLEGSPDGMSVTAMPTDLFGQSYAPASAPAGNACKVDDFDDVGRNGWVVNQDDRRSRGLTSHPPRTRSASARDTCGGVSKLAPHARHTRHRLTDGDGRPAATAARTSIRVRVVACDLCCQLDAISLSVLQPARRVAATGCARASASPSAVAPPRRASARRRASSQSASPPCAAVVHAIGCPPASRQSGTHVRQSSVRSDARSRVSMSGKKRESCERG